MSTRRSSEIVAAAGILVNLVVVALLSRARRQSLNVRGAYLHIVTDLAAFVGTGIAALLILVTGWNRLDPVAFTARRRAHVRRRLVASS